ncbi:MAG: sensor histidine kinase [Caulobacteraceae bacterium]
MELLLSELNHRWANALQVISASLHLCASRSTSRESMVCGLNKIQQQVQAMAALHQRLSRAPELGTHIGGYCNALCLDTILSFGCESITPVFEASSIPLSQGCAMRLGALVVELMTNAIKHGAVKANDGVVWMSLHLVGGDWVELSVRDNFAAPHRSDPPRPRMVEALALSLSGELTIRVRPTYTTRLRFPRS